MLRITLGAHEQAEIEQTFKTTADRQVRDRCQAVLMAHRGRKRRTIAADLNRATRHWDTHAANCEISAGAGCAACNAATAAVTSGV
jgi:hypothetical protein